MMISYFSIYIADYLEADVDLHNFPFFGKPSSVGIVPLELPKVAVGSTWQVLRVLRSTTTGWHGFFHCAYYIWHFTLVG